MMRRLFTVILLLVPVCAWGGTTPRVETAPLPARPFNAFQVLGGSNLLNGDNYQDSLDAIRKRIERELNASYSSAPGASNATSAASPTLLQGAVMNSTANASAVANATVETIEAQNSTPPASNATGIELPLPLGRSKVSQKGEPEIRWPDPLPVEKVAGMSLWRDPLRVVKIDWGKEIEKVPIPFKDSEMIAEILEDGDYQQAYNRLSLFSGQPEIDRFKKLVSLAFGKCRYVFPPTETVLLLLAKRGCWNTVVSHAKAFYPLPGGRLWVAQALFRLGRWKDALGILEKVPQGSWYRPWAMMKAGLARYAMGDLPGAIQELEASVSGVQAGSPVAENLFYLLGSLSLEGERLDAANGWFEKTIANGVPSPLDTRASYWLGWLLWKKGDLQKAAFHFSIAMKGGKRLGLEERIRAVELILDRHLPVAPSTLVGVLPASLASVPSGMRLKVQVLSGRVMLNAGRPADAVKLFRSAAKGANPCARPVADNLCPLTVRALVEAGKMDEAVNLVMSGNLTMVPSLLDGAREIMGAMVSKGLCDQAMEFGKNWGQLKNDPVLLSCMVDSYPPGKWFGIYQKAKNEGRLPLPVAVKAIYSLVENGFLDMAVVEVGDLLDAMPPPPFGYQLRFLLAKILILQGNYDKAREIAKALFKEDVSPEDVARWRIALGDACQKKENWQEALYYYQGVDNLQALVAMARCYGAMGDKERQMEIYKEIFTKGAGEPKCQAGLALAAHYLAQELPSIAFSFIENPTLCGGDRAVEFHTLRAKAMESLGRFKSAAKEYEQVFYLLPKSDPARWRMLLGAAENYRLAGYKSKAKRLLRFIAKMATDTGVKNEAAQELQGTGR